MAEGPVRTPGQELAVSRMGKKELVIRASYIDTPSDEE
jgi:hypothetical protein